MRVGVVVGVGLVCMREAWKLSGEAERAEREHLRARGWRGPGYSEPPPWEGEAN